MAKRQNALVTKWDTGRTSRVKQKAWSLCGTSLPELQYHRGLASATAAPSSNGNIQQLSYSFLSPRKSVQKLMFWDVSCSGVASPQSCSVQLEGSLSEGFNSARE